MRTLAFLAASSLALAACNATGPGEGATETNVMRVPCRTDSDCGGELRCLPIDAEAADGGVTGLCETTL